MSRPLTRSLSVARGEIYAFLGLNGAGKTTTIRLLLGMIKPTAGEAVVLGTRIGRGHGNPWQAVGYMVERPHAYPELAVRENIEAVRRLRPGTPPVAVERIIDQLGLAPYADRRTSTLSQGNRQRLGLAKALMHKPQLLILDEPANGLDPAGIVEIRCLLRELAEEEGVTIFMSSHILAEVARLADRIGIIHEGRLLQELDVADLEQQRRRWLRIDARDTQAAKAALPIGRFSGRSRAKRHDRTARRKALSTRPDDIAALLANAGHAPTMLKVEHEDLEHYFLRLVGMEEVNGQ